MTTAPPERAPRTRGPWHPATHLALLHAPPAFTVISVGLVFGLIAARGRPEPTRMLLLAGLLAGNQYAAGALNDVIDADTDAANDRRKPIQLGWISAAATRRLAVAAGVASLACALALSPVTFVLAGVGLGCAWAYDAWLKGTAASWLPFAVALPLVPMFGYAAAGRFPGVLWWVWPLGVLAALAVHLADALPDVERDRRVGVHGLATRLGVRAAAWLTGVAYTLAVGLACAVGLAAGAPLPALAGTTLAVLLGAAAVAAGVRRRPAADGGRVGVGVEPRRLAYWLLLAGIIAAAAGWAASVRP